MSHFTVGVILPLGTNGPAKRVIDGLLSAYDEGHSVAPYPRPCSCIGWVAKKRCSERANRLVGVIDRERSSDEMKRDWWETKQGYLPYEPDFNLPDPNCEECHGSGTYMSTYNPSSKWDWFQIGGRWNGCLPNGSNEIVVKELLANKKSRRPEPPDAPEGSPTWTFFYPEYLEELEQYEATPEDLRDLYAPFALLTPDGVWHEKGDMGWWGIVSDDKGLNTWLNVAKGIYEQYPEHKLVLVDCHI